MKKISILILVGTILTLSSTPPLFKGSYLKSQNIVNGYRFASSGIPTDSLVLYYPFSGNANDASGNGYDGTVSGATLTNDRDANSNSAYNFNQDTIYTASNVTYDKTKISLSIWFRSTNAASATEQVFANIEYTNFTGFQVLLLGNGNFQIYYGRFYPSNYMTFNTPSGTSYRDASWHHLVVCMDMTKTGSNRAKCYINNNLVTLTYAVSGTPVIVTADYQVALGERLNGTLPYYGDLDQVRLYYGLLTAAEINALYNE